MHRGKALFLITLVALLAVFGTPGSGQVPAEADEQLLKGAGIATDNDGLIKFFQLRSLKDGDRKTLEDLVQQLGSNNYKERESATKELILRGPVALPFLKAGLKEASLETVRRAEQIMKKIESSQGP